MENEQEKKQPSAEVAYGSVRAAVWKNETKTGPEYSFSLSRSYRDENNKQRFSRSFEVSDIVSIFLCIHSIHSKIEDLEAKEKK